MTLAVKVTLNPNTTNQWGVDDSHSDRIHSWLIGVRCFDDGYVEKQLVVRKEYCAEYLLKVLQESINRCTWRRVLSEITLKTALNTIQSINQSIILTLSQTTNFRLLQIERVCRRQFQIRRKWQKVVQKDRKQWEKEKLFVTSYFSFSHSDF